MTVVGLDLTYLAPGATGGMETYARVLVPALARRRPETRWVAFCGRELAAELKAAPWCANLDVVALPVSSTTRWARVLIEQTLLPWRIRRSGADLVHALGNTAPIVGLPGSPPLVLTIHDLIWARLPETHAGLMARGLAFLVPRAARRAARIVVPSRATGDDVRDRLGVPAARIAVTPYGPGAEAAAPVPEARLRAALGLGDGPLVLYPSPPRPHKNVGRLVEAMEGVDATLVVPGYASVAESGLERRAAASGRVRFLGWVDPAEMEGLYRAAAVLAFPSLAEGFGLPVLEAMRRGLPVVCSDTTALPEVAGDAAVLVDPHDVPALRAAISRVLGDPALRADLARRGVAQARRFSWDATAAGVWDAYDAVLAQARP